jgi:hypothetical protein
MVGMRKGWIRLLAIFSLAVSVLVVAETGSPATADAAPDTTPPVLSLPSDITDTADSASGKTVVYTATANDAVDGAVGVLCAPDSGSVFPPGETTVGCSATDAAANTASGSFKVTINPMAQPISGVVTDRHTGEGIGGICVGVSPFGQPDVLIAEALTSASGAFSINVPFGTNQVSYQVSYVDCQGWDYAAEWYGPADKILPVIVDGGVADASMALTTGSLMGLVDMSQGFWAMSAPRTDLVDGFFFGNPGDFPILGDWDCDGVDTPGMYRQSDGYVYLRNSNTQGVADIRFFFGDPGDIPLAGDFNGDGCDTVSIFRPSAARVFIINELGQNDGGLGAADFTYLFGNPGDKPFVGDFDADRIDTVGLHRESTGLVYFRNSHTQGTADVQYIFGDPGDRLVAGNFSGFWEETPAVFRPSDLTFYIRHTNTQGNADRTETWNFTGPTWYPVAGVFGRSGDDFMAQTGNGLRRQIGNS